MAGGLDLGRALIFNAELVRNLRAGLRLRRAVGVAVIVGVACFVNIAFNVTAQLDYTPNGYRINAKGLAEAARIAFFITFAVQVLVVCLQGLNRTSVSVVGERENRTWDLQRLTPASEFYIAWGKLIGPVATAWLAAAVALPAQVICVCAGGVPLMVLIKSVLVVVASGLLTATIGLCFSASVDKRKSATGGAGGIIALIVIASFSVVYWAEGWLASGLNPLWSYLALIEESDPRAFGSDAPVKPVPFFGLELGYVWMAVLNQLFLAGALLLGAMRLIRDEFATVWSKPQGVAIVAVYEFLLVAGLWASAGVYGAEEAALAGLLGGASVGLLVLLFTTPGYYHARSRLRRRLSLPQGPLEAVFGDRAPATGMVVVMWIMIAAGTLAIAGASVAPTAAVASAFVLILLLGTEALLGICEMAIKKYGRVVAVVLIVLAIAVPPIGATIADNETAIFILCPPALVVFFFVDAQPGASLTHAAIGGFVLWGIAAAVLHGVYLMQRLNLTRIMKKLSKR